MVKIEKDDNNRPSLVGMESEKEYPYGTQLDFDADMMKKLNVDDLEVGTEVIVSGMAVVKSRSEHKSDSGEDSKRMCFQMTEIDLRTEKEIKDRVGTLYGK